MVDILQLIGFAGIAIACIAYLPQISHLVREKCSAGISARAWSLWLIAAVFLFLHAIQLADPVFIALQAFNIATASLILLFANKYRSGRCASHVHG